MHMVGFKRKENIIEAKFKHFIQGNNLWVAFTAILKSISQLNVKKYQQELLRFVARQLQCNNLG